MNCPLCKGNEIRSLEIIDCEELNLLYEKKIRISVRHLIKNNVHYNECQCCKLRFFFPPLTGDEVFYNGLQLFDWYYMSDKEEFKIAANYLVKDGKVLEVGSGSGKFANYVVNGKYIGLDFSLKAKEMAASNGVTIENELVQNYVKKHQEEFDSAVSFQVLEHVADPDIFIASMFDAVKSGGRVIFAVPSEDSFIKNASNEILNLPPHHVTRWPDDTFRFIEKKYNAKLIQVHHESIQEIHKVYLMSTRIQNFFLSPKMIDLSLRRKIIGKFSNMVAKLVYRCSPKLIRGTGHTVLAIYEKV